MNHMARASAARPHFFRAMERHLLKRFTAALTLFFALLAAAPSHAWWGTGHMVVAQIAYDRLDPRAKAEVDRLIAIDALPDSNTFVTAAAWADDLKLLDVHLYDEWHYLDIPFSPDNTTLPAVEKAGNVQWAIDQCVRTLRSHKAPDVEKARSLRFLIHFVGDAHQPLHCTTRVTSAHPAGDRGGNDYPVSAGRLRNLHMYWDSAVGLFEDVKRPMDDEAAKTIRGFADRAVSANPPASFPTLSVLNSRKWVEEGSAVAQSVVYSTPEGQAPSDEYKKKTQDTSFRQIALAGYRLAALLNEIYAQK
jgi:hypothetical protein